MNWSIQLLEAALIIPSICFATAHALVKMKRTIIPPYTLDRSHGRRTNWPRYIGRHWFTRWNDHRFELQQQTEGRLFHCAKSPFTRDTTQRTISSVGSYRYRARWINKSNDRKHQSMTITYTKTTFTSYWFLKERKKRYSSYFRS